ncbi:fumarylacetoacetate hydrolase family protein [Marinilabiliaceae bacterium ANBcel2]|nr:fumarylacetoacetate hydrolase family protein [Marinilabiliaceae bacterium ANBcel2]
MKIICIGRNYEDHAKELKNPLAQEPIVFLKPDSALLRNNDPFYIPQFAKQFHYETELVVRISRLGKKIDASFAHRYYDEIGLGVDFTARDLQDELRQKGLPWEKCKAFDGSAVISKFTPKMRFPDINDVNFSLKVNGELRQQGNSGDMISSIDQLIAYVSNYFTLKIGDYIFTGTPAGVGSVNIGDRLQGYIEDRLFFDFNIK